MTSKFTAKSECPRCR